MIITDVSACVFKHTTRRHSDTAGHAHPGPAHEVQQGILTIRTEDGHEGHSFAPPEVMRPHVLDKFVRKVLIGQDHRDRERLWQELAHWQRGPVASNTTVRNVGSDLNAKERFSKNGFNHSIWAAYERGGDRQPWFQMLRAHDAAIERWRRGGDDGGGEVVAAEKGESSESGDGGAGARSRPMSHVEKTPSIAAGWQQCFAVPDNACKHQNNTGHNTGAGAGGHRNLL